jgi:C_GCAxxG_C_C family probable redox protein
MAIGKKGKEIYLEGWNCAEAVTRAVVEEKLVNIPEEMIRSASVFGYGMAGTGEICGALVGVLAVLSSLDGRTSLNENNGALYEKARKIITAFEKKFGSTCCRKITQKFREEGKMQTPERRQSCSDIIEFTLDELEKIMDEKKV